MEPFGWWRTEDGAPYCLLAAVRGRPVNAAGAEHAESCEALEILSMPLDDRKQEMGKRAAIRGRNRDEVGLILRELQRVVTEEWRFARESMGKAAA